MFFLLGKSVLLWTQSEVDKTGASYYGKGQLHYADGSGDTAMVQLGKEGPIYSGNNLLLGWNLLQTPLNIFLNINP